MELNERQTALCNQNDTDFSDLKAVFVNCTLQHPDQPSHTALLMGVSAENAERRWRSAQSRERPQGVVSRVPI